MFGHVHQFSNLNHPQPRGESNTEFIQDYKAPVIVSRAYITTTAGYVCVVRIGTALDKAYHLPPYATAQKHQGREEVQ